MAEEVIGKITHFFPKISVAVLSLSGDLKVGDKIKLQGEKDSFEQEVTSMEVEHESINEARAGDDVGLKTNNPVKKNSDVLKIIE
ncbi:MAG: EF-Tu/IF-2/RF-3 family GTPase [Nanoarchaeota archaeon]|nr:EF-Tu/IF-2/RF-3 family GTPase [Nanoarchaeota archaeon]